MPFTFTQVITQRSFPNGVEEPRETGPSIRITVTADEGFPVSPDAVSTELGHFVMRLLAPGQNASVRSRVDPWPLPDGWHGQAPPLGARETMADQKCAQHPDRLELGCFDCERAFNASRRGAAEEVERLRGWLEYIASGWPENSREAADRALAGDAPPEGYR